MEEIRKWAKLEYKDPSYYHWIKVTHIHRDEIIRYVVFPDAFIANYREEIDPHTGDGIYTITLMQKLDKRIDIEIGPFNEVHPRLSDLLEASSQRREAQRLAAAAALAGAFAGGKEDEEQEWNSPYWIMHRHVVRPFIIINNNANLHANPGHDILSVSIPRGTIRNVLEARIIAGNIWYRVSHSNETGWISGGAWPRERDSATTPASEFRGSLEGQDVDTPNPSERWIVVLSSGVALIRHRGIPRTDTLPRIFIEEYFDKYDLLEGTEKAAGGNNRGLVNGAWVEVKNPYNPRIENGWIEIERNWGVTDRVLDTNQQGRVINIPKAIRGTITTNGTSESVTLDPRRLWFSHYHRGAFERGAEGRIKVAVGPRVKDPNYPDDGRIWNEDFDFPIRIDAVLEHRETRQTRVLELITESSSKAHTFNRYPHELHPRERLFLANTTVRFDVESGISQTGIAYPRSWNALNESQFSRANLDASTIEFKGQQNSLFNPNDYYLLKIIVLD